MLLYHRKKALHLHRLSSTFPPEKESFTPSIKLGICFLNQDYIGDMHCGGVLGMAF